MEMSCQLHAQAVLPPGKQLPVPTELEDVSVQVPVGRFGEEKNLAGYQTLNPRWATQ
jgi:hypothetical protein